MSDSILAEYSAKVFNSVRLRLRFRDRVLAGIPKNEKMLDYFMTARHMSDAEKADFQKRIEDGKLSAEESEAIKETAWCEFEKDADGNLCLWHGNIKAMLREIFVTFGLTQKSPNTKKKDEEGNALATSAGGRQTLQHAIHVDPLRILFERGGNPIKTPDGQLDKVKHIKDAAGQRSALGRHDFLDKVEMVIILKWPAKGCFTEDEMKRALAACQEDGIGACRSQGFGKFDVTEWETR